MEESRGDVVKCTTGARLPACQKMPTFNKNQAMPVKVSEKKLFLSLVLFISGLALLWRVKLFPAPVHISEKGVAVALFSLLMIYISIRLYKRAATRM
jgi:hypothetical protein